ncbi:helix-turn-helix domain-containing protein [Nocardioides sp.]|uniref:winged helix-turn-helix transcriptional regulator n=1 Tax=Nocardioides sp. TaxID=35761 RepID=UPI002B626CE4|nr:helix-turn-helix domain-containing protein [Nocardioides sp.]HXH81079.1 helix-turn-helix domain-containing protein [Nocardioides sp.]
MDRDDWDLTPDSVQLALEHLVPASAGKVVREAFYGTRRFDDFVRRTGLTAPVLSARLRDLEASGVIEKRPYREPGQRTRHEYRLTQQGQDLGTAVVALLEWADRWLPTPDGPTVVLEHRECGASVHVAMGCSVGHGVDITDVVALPGPGARRVGTS